MEVTCLKWECKGATGQPAVVWFVEVTDQLSHLFADCNIFKTGKLLFHISD